MAIWDGLLSAEEQQVFDTFRMPKPLGVRPAIIVVDVNYAFVGTSPKPLLESVQEFSTSCGALGWEGVARIKELLLVAREHGVPVIYTTGMSRPRRGAGWATRARDERTLGEQSEAELEHQRLGNTIVADIAPERGDVVIEKRAASGFLGTPMTTYLNEMDVDTVLVTGTSTSGCVRATAVDAACSNYYVGIVEDCCFDRFQISHKVNLMDMHAKYGRVISLGEAQEYVRGSEAVLPQRAEAMLSR